MPNGEPADERAVPLSIHPFSTARLADVPVTCGAAFDILDRGFRDAKIRQPRLMSERDLAIAGRPVQLACVGDTLLETILAPCSHLIQEKPSKAVPRVTIEAWSAHETGVYCPGLRVNQPKLGLYSSSDGRYVTDWRSDYVAALDRHARRLVAKFPSSVELSIAHRTKPLLFPLAVWCSDLGLQIVHSALVAKNGKGVLIAGPGGSGKSTASLVCLLSGYQFLGDDQVAIEHTPDGFTGFSLFGSINLNPREVQRALQSLNACSGAARVVQRIQSNGTGKKEVLQLAQIVPELIETCVSIDALVVPRFDPDRVQASIRPLNKSSAFLALVPETLGNPANPYRRCVPLLGELIRETPCYELLTNTNLADLAACIDGIIDDPRAA